MLGGVLSRRGLLVSAATGAIALTRGKAIAAERRRVGVLDGTIYNPGTAPRIEGDILAGLAAEGWPETAVEMDFRWGNGDIATIKQ